MKIQNKVLGKWCMKMVTSLKEIMRIIVNKEKELLIIKMGISSKDYFITT